MSSKKIDPRIKGLVKVINSLPGIQTIMSCGGHKKPISGSNQVPENEFYVEFGFTTAYPSPQAWESLNIISLSINEIASLDWAGADKYFLKIELVKDDNKIVSFRLHGREVQPSAIATKIEQMMGTHPLKTLKPRTPVDKMIYPRLSLKELESISTKIK